MEADGLMELGKIASVGQVMCQTVLHRRPLVGDV
jgi:hypothetical protein